LSSKKKISQNQYLKVSNVAAVDQQQKSLPKQIFVKLYARALAYSFLANILASSDIFREFSFHLGSSIFILNHCP
jgi:hypothetical protein